MGQSRVGDDVATRHLLSRIEGSLDLLGLVFRHALLDVSWHVLDEILRFLQPEAREDWDFPDDFDLLLANGLRTTARWRNHLGAA
jgi:hypothetical protein